jgi:hypothetical protein
MYNNSNDTIDYSVDTETIGTEITYYNKTNVNTINNNKNFILAKRKIDNRKKTEIGYFTTSYIPKSKIVNAITGLKYRDEDPKLKILVGSIHEDLLFKARISNGGNNQEPVLLFYDSPEQFEKHQYILLNQKLKEAWLNKRIQYLYSKRSQKD